MNYNQTAPAFKQFAPKLTQGEQRTGQIPDQLQLLTRSVEDMEKCIEILHQRLSPISSSCPTPTPKDQDAPIPTICPIADSIRNNVERIESLCERLRKIEQAIEL